MTGDHERPILPPSCLGVIGGGQLGRMFVQAAQRMGYRTIVQASTDDEPAAQVAHEVAIGPPGDRRALEQLLSRAQAVTVEFENVSAPALRWISRRIPTRPGWRTVWITQDRLREKTFLARAGVPTAPWRPVRTPAELQLAAAELGAPLILKTSSSGYDGKGQIRVDDLDGLEPAWSSLRRVPCVAEGVVPFDRELSVLVARGVDGSTTVYPPAWNSHDRHILDLSVMPASLEPPIAADLSRLAERIATAIDLVGVLCVEFFLTADGRVMVNELAPRPHNSGHLTIEAAGTSQFEQQVRALCGLPLGPATLTRPAAMANLLGDLWSSGEPDWAAAFRADPAIHLHLYGKGRAAPGRKMGHLTVLDDTAEGAAERVARARLAAGRIVD